MSVALIIEMDSSHEETYLPIATEHVFITYWSPVFREEDFKWLPLFLSGISLVYEDLDLVIDELSVFIVAVEMLRRRSPVYATIHERASRLRHRLQTLKDEVFLDIFIG